MNILDEINCQATDIVVYETKDFDKFHFIKTNRAINKAHVKDLEQSIRDKGYLKRPIQVGSDGSVKEGQHRFSACKNLDHPILFIIDDEITMSDIQKMNTSHLNWDVLTACRSNAAKGYTSYQLIMKLYERFNSSFQRCNIFNIYHIFMALFNREKIKPEAYVNQGLLSVTPAMYEAAYKKLEWVESIINYYRAENLKFTGSVSCMIFALLWCYSCTVVPNDRIYEILTKCFQESQDWSKTASCLAEIDRKYKNKYKVRNWKGLVALYEKDPKRTEPVPFYEREDQQPITGGI